MHSCLLVWSFYIYNVQDFFFSVPHDLLILFSLKCLNSTMDIARLMCLCAVLTELFVSITCATNICVAAKTELNYAFLSWLERVTLTWYKLCVFLFGMSAVCVLFFSSAIREPKCHWSRWSDLKTVRFWHWLSLSECANGTWIQWK